MISKANSFSDPSLIYKIEFVIGNLLMMKMAQCAKLKVLLKQLVASLTEVKKLRKS